MFNKKIFCSGRFRWIVIAIGITAACASGHKAQANSADKNPPAVVAIFEGNACAAEDTRLSGRHVLFIAPAH